MYIGIYYFCTSCEQMFFLALNLNGRYDTIITVAEGKRKEGYHLGNISEDPLVLVRFEE